MALFKIILDALVVALTAGRYWVQPSVTKIYIRSLINRANMLLHGIFPLTMLLLSRTIAVYSDDPALPARVFSFVGFIMVCVMGFVITNMRDRHRAVNYSYMIMTVEAGLLYLIMECYIKVDAVRAVHTSISPNSERTVLYLLIACCLAVIVLNFIRIIWHAVRQARKMRYMEKALLIYDGHSGLVYGEKIHKEICHIKHQVLLFTKSKPGANTFSVSEELLARANRAFCATYEIAIKPDHAEQIIEKYYSKENGDLDIR